MTSGKYENLNNEGYWEQRSLEKEDKYFQLAENLITELKKVYGANLKDIEKEVAFFYSKYAVDGSLSYSDSTKFNRLNILMKNIKDIIFKMVGQEQISIEDLLCNICEGNYYEAIYAVQTGLNLGFNFARIDEKTIKNIVTYPWSGEAYSKRIWNNCDKLIDSVKKTLMDGFIRGESNKKMASSLNETMQVGYSNAARLIRTESTYVANKSTTEGYKECDVEQYKYLATLDLRTSSICRSLDGKIFNTADAQAGKNLPSMHPNCRSTTTPYFGSDYVRRIARAENGKTYYVDGKMTYNEWYDKYVKNNPQALKKEKKIQNKSSDKKQYEKYKSVLGKDVPKSFDKFQELKYNNSNEYSQLKKIYTVKNNIRNGTQKLDIEEGKQGKHIKGHNNYIEGRSYLTISKEEAQKLVDKYAGTGTFEFDRKGNIKNKELVQINKNIGVNINNKTGDESKTNRFYIHYSKSGTHVVPTLKGVDKK